MYPRLFEIPLPFEILGRDSIEVFSFGAMVAVAFFVASWLSAKEMDRLYHAGRLKGVRVPVDEKGSSRRGATREASPSVLIGTMTMIAIVGGFLGAKVFHILENLDEFVIAPGRMLFSSGGFTFYGGLIVAAVALVVFVRKKGLRVALVADALAPSLILAYGIGRIGCYLSGDGDWGVCSSLADKPAFLPDWLWSETFPNNYLGVDVLAACGAGFDGVFPTMLYEFAMAAVLFGVLWALRKHPFLPGWIFSLYLVFTGVERFLIEQIRVNNVFELLGMSVTQAEIISVGMILVGVAGLVRTTKRRPTVDAGDPVVG